LSALLIFLVLSLHRLLISRNVNAIELEDVVGPGNAFRISVASVHAGADFVVPERGARACPSNISVLLGLYITAYFTHFGSRMCFIAPQKKPPAAGTSPHRSTDPSKELTILLKAPCYSQRASPFLRPSGTTMIPLLMRLRRSHEQRCRRVWGFRGSGPVQHQRLSTPHPHAPLHKKILTGFLRFARLGH